MKDIDAAVIVLGALEFQSRRNALLLVEFHQNTASGRRFGKSGVLHFAALSREMVHHVVQLPMGQNVQHDNGASNLFDFARIIVGWQLWIGRQIVVGQLRIAGRNVLLLLLLLEFIDWYQILSCKYSNCTH